MLYDGFNHDICTVRKLFFDREPTKNKHIHMPVYAEIINVIFRFDYSFSGTTGILVCLSLHCLTFF